MRLTLCSLWTLLILSGCGGRTALVALPQIGQIADNAVIDNAAGITVVARSGMWAGPPLGDIIPLELTINNGGSAPVRLRHTDFAFVTPRGRIRPLAPPFESAGTDAPRPAAALAQRALREGVLQPAAETKGFIYFSGLDDAGAVDLVATFVEPSTDALIATVTMSFEVD